MQNYHTVFVWLPLEADSDTTDLHVNSFLDKVKGMLAKGAGKWEMEEQKYKAYYQTSKNGND